MPLYRSYGYWTKFLFKSKEYKARFKVPNDQAMRTKKKYDLQLGETQWTSFPGFNILTKPGIEVIFFRHII